MAKRKTHASSDGDKRGIGKAAATGGLQLRIPDVERVPMAQFAERAYLHYSMYVILDRALPHIGDGLKTGTTSDRLCDVRTRVAQRGEI